MTNISNIRNFSIIAHIDHGKSTLADRLIEHTQTIEKRLMKEQVLDTMDLERERGITIKLQAIRMNYRAKDEKEYALNLIDTPGHVDFTYEVSRSLAASEGALLIVDASQGIEAQTLANAHLAQAHNLKIIPVINKIDLPQAEPSKVTEELINLFGVAAEEIILISAKEGTGTTDVLEAIVKRIPSPKGKKEKNLQALIFDSIYDSYRGVIVYTRVVHGEIKAGMNILLMGAQKEFEVQEVGIFNPKMTKTGVLSCGEVGYVIANIKTVSQARVGDTITSAIHPAPKSLPGYKKIKPMVFSGFYPQSGEDYRLLKDALEKLQLNDAALTFEPESSNALGLGFRLGFMGLLHLDIVKERLKREHKADLIATTPSVIYKVIKNNNEEIFIDNPTKLPPPQEIEIIEEPYLRITILTPSEFVGKIMEVTQERRGEFKNMEYLDPTRTMLTYELPMSEMITDFFDQLKSASRGYASLDYEIIGYRPSKLVKLDILLNQEPFDAFSAIVHKEKAYRYGQALVKKLKKVIPRHLFEIPIQAAIGKKIIARETIKAMRKDVTAKLYGGDVTRKRKLLEIQKRGKKKMKKIGKVSIPPEAFMSILKIT